MEFGDPGDPGLVAGFAEMGLASSQLMFRWVFWKFGSECWATDSSTGHLLRFVLMGPLLPRNGGQSRDADRWPQKRTSSRPVLFFANLEIAARLGSYAPSEMWDQHCLKTVEAELHLTRSGRKWVQAATLGCSMQTRNIELST